MTQRSDAPWVVDGADPRAPPADVWERMSPQERAAVVESLPSEFEPSETAPPEGDRHWNPQVSARKTLERYFSRAGRRVYVGADLPIYYPGESMFATDVFAVLDVEPHERDRWVVSDEGKGLDFALEIHVAGHRKKDHVRNVEWFARLGIPEYFVFDRNRLRLTAFRLRGGTYEPLVPQRGRYPSRVLGLDLAIVESRLRFFQGDAALPDADDLIDQLERLVEQEARRREESERQREESERQREETSARLEAALAEIERLRRDPR